MLTKEAKLSTLARLASKWGLNKVRKGGLGFGNLLANRRVIKSGAAEHIEDLRRSVLSGKNDLSINAHRVLLDPKKVHELDRVSRIIQLETLAPGSSKHWDELINSAVRKANTTSKKLADVRYLNRAIMNNLTELPREYLTPRLRNLLKGPDNIWLTGTSALSRNSEVLHQIVPNLRFLYGKGPAKSGFIKAVNEFVAQTMSQAAERNALLDFVESLRK